MRSAEKCIFVNRLQHDWAHADSIPAQSIFTFWWTAFHCVMFCGWQGFLLSISFHQLSTLILLLLLSKRLVGGVWEPFNKAMLFRISWSTGQRSTVTFKCEITECRYLVARIFEGRAKGRKKERPWHMVLGRGGGKQTNGAKSSPQLCQYTTYNLTILIAHICGCSQFD